ncbi:MAG: hypothetical protein ACYDCH_08735 [Gaiellaceae bacterium]
MRARSPYAWPAALVALAAFRLAIPLAVVADTGSRLPGVPEFSRSRRDGGLSGDATGFYAATREFMAAPARLPRPLLALTALALLAAAIAVVLAWRRRPAWRAWLVPVALFAFGLAVCVDIRWMKPSGAAVFGWPLVWGLALLPIRIAAGLSKHVAWDVGVALSLAFVGLTVAAVAYLGRHASGRRWVGLAAAAAWAAWPLLVGVIAGHHAWANNQWNIDAGLANYDEPLSTLLVTSGAALLLAPRATALRLAAAGCVLSVATCVKLSNALFAALALIVVALRGRRREALPFLAGLIAFAPVVAFYWPLSYPKLFHNRRSWPVDPFDAAHVVSSWTRSSIFTPHTLAIVVPLAALGIAGLRRPWPVALVLALLLVNPAFYSFYANTAQHPRFLYASLPALFVLWAAGVAVLASFARRRAAAA